MKKILFGLALIGGFASSAHADLILTSAAPTASVNFEGYTGAGFTNGTGTTGVGSGLGSTAGTIDSSTFATTGMSEGASAFGANLTTAGDFARGTITTADPTTAGFYALATSTGTANPANTAFGFQATGAEFNPGTITTRATNSTGGSLSGFNVSYDIFVRNNASRSSTFNFSYSLDNATYTSVSAFDFTSPDALQTGALFAGTNKSGTVSGLNIADGAQFYLRFSSADVAGTGSRDEIGFDNLSLSGIATAPVPEPSTIALFVIGLGGMGFAMRRKKSAESAAANDSALMPC